MKKRWLWLPILLVSVSLLRGDDATWANLQPKLTDAFRFVPTRKLPGRAVGILVPGDSREDLLTLSAFGQGLMDNSYRTLVFIMQAPEDYPLDGIAVPGGDLIATTAGLFAIDTVLRDQLKGGAWPATVDENLFVANVPQALQNQLSLIKHDGIRTSLTILPLYVRFSDASSQVRDWAPALVDRIRETGADNDVAFIVLADLTRAISESALIQSDATVLRAIRNMDIDALITLRAQLKESGGGTFEDFDSLLMGLLTLRWFGSDHGEVAAYAHSAQMVLTKDKSRPVGYAAAGFASGPLIAARMPHVKPGKTLEIFNELFRADILTTVRQTLMSALDATAAQPPALPNEQAAKKWPVYVTIFDAQGKLAGQAGAHKATGPLEESLRRYTAEAVKNARPGLTKENAKEHVIEVSIPYGFETMSRPDDYVPLLNGAIIILGAKTAALPPVAWRAYPDPHQLLGEISHRLSAKPWAYALNSARLDSFRVMAFNEKEPFIELAAPKKKKGKNQSQDSFDDMDSGGSSGGGSPFSF